MLDIKRKGFTVNASAMLQASDSEELMDYGTVQSRPLAPLCSLNLTSGAGQEVQPSLEEIRSFACVSEKFTRCPKIGHFRWH